jgi:hypothetical protein
MKSKSLLISIIAALFLLSCATVEPKPAPLVSDCQTMVEQTSVSAVFNETPFFLTEPPPEQTLASRNQYYLEDIYDYDEVFFITQPVIRQTLASRNQYYLEDIYDYDEPFLTTQLLIKQPTDSKNISDYFAILSIFDETPSFSTEPAPEQTLASGNQYYLEDIYDYDNPFHITKSTGRK